MGEAVFRGHQTVNQPISNMMYYSSWMDLQCVGVHAVEDFNATEVPQPAIYEHDNFDNFKGLKTY